MVPCQRAEYESSGVAEIAEGWVLDGTEIAAAGAVLTAAGVGGAVGLGRGGCSGGGCAKLTFTVTVSARKSAAKQRKQVCRILGMRVAFDDEQISKSVPRP